jgi:hypothetical protein
VKRTSASVLGIAVSRQRNRLKPKRGRIAPKEIAVRPRREFDLPLEAGGLRLPVVLAVCTVRVTDRLALPAGIVAGEKV